MDQPKKINNIPIPVHNLKELYDVVEQDWKNPHCKLRKSIEIQLYRYGLSTYDAYDIFADAVLRAVKHLERNDEIPHILGWLHNTSYKIIQEEYRKKLYRTKVVKKLSSKDEFTSKSNADIFSDEEMSLVADLINSLDPLEKSIIVWKSKRLKWKQICLKLAEEKLISMDDLEDPKTLERIKRRGNRAAYKIKNLIQEASKVYN